MGLPTGLVSELRETFGEQFTTAAIIREQHGKGESFHPLASPDGVLFARSTEEVAAAVRACNAYDTPIVPFGAGTSLEGHVSALAGGLSIDVSQMNAVLTVSPEDMTATVQAGVTRQQLNAYLRDTGLFFAVDPGAESTLGGMAATRASGTCTVRYGTMRENIVSMEVVLADGRIVRTASLAAKSSAGYDLTRLFIGSEGTLGIVTELTVKLWGIPEAVTSAVCSFPTTEAAITTVTTTLQAGLPLARVEFLDETVMGAVARYSHLDNYRVAPTLFFELHGSPDSVASQAEDLKSIAEDLGGQDFRWTANAEEGTVLWEARHKALYAIKSIQPGMGAWSTDSCVPRSRMAEMILAAQADIASSFLEGCIVGHVGDGNFHVTFLVDPENRSHMAEAERLSKAITHRAIAAGGTCTGEHGIGYGKIAYLEEELGEAVDVMRAIKTALDPKGLMNPGKVLRRRQI